MERFKVGDLVRYRGNFDEVGTIGLVTRTRSFRGIATVFVRWCDHPHADVIGDTAEYTEPELIVVLKAQTPYERFNGKSKNFE